MQMHILVDTSSLQRTLNTVPLGLSSYVHFFPSDVLYPILPLASHPGRRRNLRCYRRKSRGQSFCSDSYRPAGISGGLEFPVPPLLSAVFEPGRVVT